jgi:predicted PurR-regulated permease PerM
MMSRQEQTGARYSVPLAIVLAATAVITLVAIWSAAQALLLFFGAILLATLLRAATVAQERLVYLPPAMTLISEVLMGVWFGLIGIVFATPLAAALLPVTRTLYLEDTLHEPRDGDGTPARKGHRAA